MPAGPIEGCRAVVTNRVEVAYDAVVLAGGRSRRLGGRDKAALDVAGRSSLDRVLDAVADATRTVVVGPRRPTARGVVWCREEPPYGGPPAAVAAGAAETTAAVVVVLACDAPLVSRAAVGLLVGALGRHDAAWFVDGEGRDQYLVGAYRREVLARAGSARSLRAAFEGLDVVRLDDVAGIAADMDDWAGVAGVRRAAGGPMLEEWTAALAAALGIDIDIDEALLLDVARDAAHGVARPAAPLTTFLVGYAAAKMGGSAEDVASASALAQRLAGTWPTGGTDVPQ